MGGIVEKSKVREGVESNTVLVNKNKKTVTINKVDKKGTPLANVEFSVFNYKEDAKENKNVVENKSTDNKGEVTFTLPDYYGVFIKETKAPKGYKISDEIIHVYKDNGVRFIGEMSPEYMKIEQIEIGNGVGKPDPNGNINEKLQGLISGGYNPYRDTNWLVFNDNGKEKLISKKPLKFDIAWNILYKAGVVFGQEGIDDLINADFSETDYYDSSMGEDSGKDKRTPKTYKPSYVTINNKKYIIRLTRTYNEKVGINDNHDWNQYDDRF